MANDSASKHVLSRRVAPFAPLALSLAAAQGFHAAATSSPAEANAEAAVPAHCEKVTDILDCHNRYPSGCSASTNPKYDAVLNVLKNKLLPPSQPNVTVRMLGQKDFQELDSETPAGTALHADDDDALTELGEGTTVGVVGYLYYSKVSGPETSNCQIGTSGSAADEEDFDYHIGIGFDSSVASQIRAGTLDKSDTNSLQQNSVIVEMTPHYRHQFEEGKWTSSNLKAVVGHQVKVIGQLLVDSEHNLKTQNCAIAETAKERSSCWRASVWEVHPVTQFLVCKSGNACPIDSPDWQALDQAAAAQ